MFLPFSNAFVKLFFPRYLEPLAKLLKNKEVVIPGKRSATRNPGFSSSSGFRLSPE
jgi:hypothetical protein